MNVVTLNRRGVLISWSLGGFFTAAFAATVYSWLNGPFTICLFNFSLLNLPIKLSFRIDILSTLILSMVCLLGTLISIYSTVHLKGERKSGYFYKWFIITLSAVSVMVLSSNLIQFFCMWLTTSWGLHQLLIYYRDRPQAVNAARKKFLISRLGDLALLIGIVLSYQTFSTFEFQEIFDQLSPTFRDQNQIQLTLIALFYVLGAMTKSAQMPFHFWLPETMETPSPVSALMHAGIINAGGFLLIRLNPVIQSGVEAQLFLTFVGAITAIFGSLVMITQNHIKKKLAYSTISQMGMMMFACGIGAYSIALLHMISHSFYKAYAFLTTGTQIEESKRSYSKINSLLPKDLLFISLIGLFTAFAGLFLYQGQYSSYLLYLGILIIGIFQNGSVIFSKVDRNLISFERFLKLIFAIGFVCSVEIMLNHKFSNLFPSLFVSTLDLSSKFILLLISYFIFAAGIFLHAIIMQPRNEFSRRLYYYFWNGGYFSLLSDELTQSVYRNLSKQIDTTDISLSKEPAHADT